MPTTMIVDGVPVEMTPEQEATLPKPPPTLDPADNTFQDEAVWPSLTA
jgi:hypothetical protein